MTEIQGDRFIEIKSHWLTLIGEKWQDENQNLVEYWRVEKADSLIILPVLKKRGEIDRLLLPHPVYRPGLGAKTLDFPGGRFPSDQTPEYLIPQILERELGIDPAAIADFQPINKVGWAVNSSFSNQKLYGYVAALSPDYVPNSSHLGSSYEVNQTGIAALLETLSCLQCRGLLLEWWHRCQG
ncbi:MAG: NUDIX hydrolase [Microcystaceae cyanobacterium]